MLERHRPARGAELNTAANTVTVLTEEPIFIEQPASFDIGSVIDGRFRILSAAQPGGMSAVYKAEDLDYGVVCALKIALPTSNLNLAALSFEREERALRDLSHPNIATYIDSGKTESIGFVALEWLSGGSLAQRIQSAGPVVWVDFYEEIGRKILLALAYAHRREWAHRDLKPQNILFDDADNPKIIDFGIARDTTQSQINQTFSRSGSPPYTPPEHDDSYQSTCRDVFSWAAIAISCLSGKIFSDHDSMMDALKSQGNKAIPKADLERALSLKAKNRQEAANILLADMDKFHMAALLQTQSKGTIFFQTPNSVIVRQLTDVYNAIPSEAVGNYIEQDFNSTWAATFEADTNSITVIGATIRAVCKVELNTLKIEKITILGPQRAEELREPLATVPGFSFSSGVPTDIKIARSNLRALTQRLDIVDDIGVRAAEEKQRNYWFDCWSDFLREKERIYKSKQLGIVATNIVSDGQYFLATVEGDLDRDQLGESLVITSNTGKPLIFVVVDLQADQLILLLKSGSRTEVPRGRTTLETNFEAERKAIQKQRFALDDIRTGRAVDPKLGCVLSAPETAQPATMSGGAFPEFLSEDKRQVLDKAMGVESILAVNGPPGTGKTTLIAELIESYLNRYPSRRILLSSQTHVALDNIIAKLVDKGMSKHVVRISSFGSENAHKISKTSEPLTLENKVREWCVLAEKRSEEFVEKYAKNLGLNAFDIKAELLGHAYVQAKSYLATLQASSSEISKTSAQIDNKFEDEIDQGMFPDTDALVAATESVVFDREALNEAIESTEARLSRLRASLNKMDGLGDLFSSALDTELNDLLIHLQKPSQQRNSILPIIQLHIDWINRLGSERSFHGAVMKEARVIAGTCIGLGSTVAFQQESFDLCIIDEASKATATETLVPMSRSRSTILVGDPEQLPPYIEREDAGSTFEISEDARKSLLSVLLVKLPGENVEELFEQRRMCSSIGQMISEIFYEGKLNNVRPDSERKRDITTLYPRAVTWLSTSRKKLFDYQTPEKSFKNEGEAEIVVDELKKIARKTRGKTEKIHVAVISAYAAQVAYLKHLIGQHVGVHDGFSIEINTVDAFQGREADICIYSVTRSNDQKQIGFQREKKRLNVALSRARDALVLVGDFDFCSKIGGESAFMSVTRYLKLNNDFCELRHL
jgi:superfamily I DNA and/or RNA helicase